MTKQLVVHKAWGGTLGTLPEAIGRAVEGLLWLPMSVSKQHLVIWVEDDKVKFCDNGSTNGTWEAETDEDAVRTLALSGADVSLSGQTMGGQAGQPRDTVTMVLFVRKDQTEGEEIDLKKVSGRRELPVGQYVYLGVACVLPDVFPAHVRVSLVEGEETDTERHVTIMVEGCRFEPWLPPISDDDIPVPPNPTDAGT